MTDERPIYKQLVFAGSDPSDRTITLALGSSPEHVVGIDISLALVGPLMAAVHAEAHKLNEDLAEEERANTSTLNANAVFLSQIGSKPAIVFELANGSLLPLVLNSMDNIAGFAAELTLLAKPADGMAN